MNKSVLKEHIINNPMSYRELITIPKEINFGLEIELEGIDPEKVCFIIKNEYSGWTTKPDNSLAYNGIEIVSPVLNNTKKTWLLLKEIGKLLQKLNATFDNCSFQVNYDDALLPTLKGKVLLLKLFAVYEDIIFRFSKGTDKYYRESLNVYCSPLILVMKDMLKFDDEFIVEKFTEQKRYGISFKNKTKKLIEFRTANGTNNPILMQNYITMFYYLLLHAFGPLCHEEQLDEYISKFNKVYLLENYELLKLDKAKEFSDRIFTKSIDKDYFLEQYIGRDFTNL